MKESTEQPEKSQKPTETTYSPIEKLKKKTQNQTKKPEKYPKSQLKTRKNRKANWEQDSIVNHGSIMVPSWFHHGSLMVTKNKPVCDTQKVKIMEISVKIYL